MGEGEGGLVRVRWKGWIGLGERVGLGEGWLGLGKGIKLELGVKGRNRVKRGRSRVTKGKRAGLKGGRGTFGLKEG